MTAPEAVIVGSGPNGLAAALVFAEAGFRPLVLEAHKTIGGGTRTDQITLPGFYHDLCAAFHPLGAVSPFFARIPWEKLGVEWIVPPVQVAHPLPGGRAAALFHSLDQTVDRLGPDGPTWRQLVGPLVSAGACLGPRLLGKRPWGPLPPGSLVRRAWPASRWAGQFRTPENQALLGGIAAHSMASLRSPVAGLTGLTLGALAHLGGWPLIGGGTHRLTLALADRVRSLGGVIHTGRPVRHTADLPRARVILFDTHPASLAEIFGGDVPSRVSRRLNRGRNGTAAYKIDFALDGPIPWTAPECARAGTVHLGGTWAEMISAQAQVAAGQVPARPFVLVGQQSLFDPRRAPPGKHTAWMYTHVPWGYADDPAGSNRLADQVESRVEEYAPGFRDLVLARSVMGPGDLERYNPNYRGGDIALGAFSVRRLLGWAGPSANPYRTGIPNVFLCSAATPPGPGVHGMCGMHAAQLALQEYFNHP